MEPNTNTLPQLVNCDWLQFWCLWDEWDADKWTAKSNYKVTAAKRGTRVFAEVWNVVEKAAYTNSHRDEPFATMCMNPYSPLIDKKMVLVKIENRPLYHANLYRRVVLMITAFGFHYKAITRLDICCDLVRFADGLLPLSLLEGYFSNMYAKTGSRSWCRWANAPYTATTIPYTITEEVRRREHTTHSISWGGATADAHVKLYNKTREIRVESHKEYIRHWWRLNGLVTEEDVWRVEISVGGRSRTLVDNSTAEVVPVSLLEACAHRYQVATFLALAERHFRFIDVSTATRRKDARTLHLFDLDSAVKFSTITTPSKPIPSRTAKVCWNYLYNLPTNTDLAAFCKSDIIAARKVYECMLVLADVYGEQQYVSNKARRFMADEVEQKIADLELSEFMGVSRWKGSAERFEDMLESLIANDRREKFMRQQIEEFLTIREMEREAAYDGAQSGSQ